MRPRRLALFFFVAFLIASCGTSTPTTTASQEPVLETDPSSVEPRTVRITGNIDGAGNFSGETTQTIWPFRDELASEADSEAVFVTYDSDGNELLRQPTAVGRQTDDFVELVPYESGIRSVLPGGGPGDVSIEFSFARVPELHAVALELEGREVWRESASANSPNVEVETEGSTVSWAATDPDGDSLTVLAYYTPDDGESWETVAGEGTSFTTSASDSGDARGDNWVDLQQLALAGGPEARVVVFASDGFHAAIAQTEPIEVGQAAPEVFLSSPTDGRSVNGRTFVRFEARISVPGQPTCSDDCDDAELEVTWSSDLDGEFARGASLELFPEPPSGLIPLQSGTHLITVTVADTHGNVVTETVTLMVG